MSEPLEVRSLWTAVERRIGMVLVIIAACGLLGYLHAATSDSTYEASSTLLIASEPGVDELDPDRALAAQRLALTLSELVRRQPVLEPVAARLGIAEDWQKIRGRVSATLIPETRVLRITATAGSPEEAEELAAAVADSFIDYSQEVLPSQAVVIDEAFASTEPISPNTALTVLAAVVGGAVLAFGVAQLLEWRQGRGAPGADEVQVIPLGERRVLWRPRREPDAEQMRNDYRRALAQIFAAAGDAPLRSILVTGTSPSTSYGTVAAQCAAALAEGGAKTLLVQVPGEGVIETDSFGPRHTPGTDAFLATPSLSIADIKVHAEAPRLEMVLAGDPVPGAPVHLRHQRVGALFEESVAAADIVIFVGPLGDPLSGVEQLAGLVQLVAVTGFADDEPEDAAARMQRSPIDTAVVALSILEPEMARMTAQLADELSPQRPVGLVGDVAEPEASDVGRPVLPRPSTRRWARNSRRPSDRGVAASLSEEADMTVGFGAVEPPERDESASDGGAEDPFDDELPADAAAVDKVAGDP